MISITLNTGFPIFEHKNLFLHKNDTYYMLRGIFNSIFIMKKLSFPFSHLLKVFRLYLASGSVDRID